jgi:hypothetical protein
MVPGGMFISHPHTRGGISSGLKSGMLLGGRRERQRVEVGMAGIKEDKGKVSDQNGF